MKKNIADGEVVLSYDKNFEIDAAMDEHLTVYEPGDVGLTLCMPYVELVMPVIMKPTDLTSQKM